MIYLSDEDDSDDDEDAYEVSKRQAGHTIVDKQSKCEIQCIHGERFPTRGKGKTVGQAAKVCAKRCPNPNLNQRGGKKNCCTKKTSISNSNTKNNCTKTT